MRYLFWASAVCVGFWAARLPAQSSAPSPANLEVTGSGPKVEIQESANGTLDVAGARGSDVNLTGGNLRGNYGASSPQAAAAAGQGTNATGLPDYSIGAPAVRLTLPDSAADAVARGAKPSHENLGLANEVILPRFLPRPPGSGHRYEPGTVENWRYKFSNGRWWYWKPGNTWAYLDRGRWTAYTEPR